MRCVGFVSFGQKAIWSVFTPLLVVTTRALRPFAKVIRLFGFASACACVTASFDEFGSVSLTPKFSLALLFNRSWVSLPKSLRATATPVSASMVAANAATNHRLRGLNTNTSNLRGAGSNA